MKLSVVICAHNPREEYLQRALAALRAQTLGYPDWELLLVDNASDIRLSTQYDLSWHPCSRHIREDTVGLTWARIRGIDESRGRTITFVDDDNLLEVSYLETALSILDDFKQLTAIGAGTIAPEFEEEPTPEVSLYLNMLALRKEDQPHWGNFLSYNASIPFGAGLCVLRGVAEAYANSIRGDRTRSRLDRQGTALVSGGDIDLALYACKTGGGTGVFPNLCITHLIPRNRLTPSYLVSLAEGHAYSYALLARIWNFDLASRENGLLRLLRRGKKMVSTRGLARRICLAEWRGIDKAGHINLNLR